MEFGERLKSLRLERDMTQEQLAQVLNVTRPTIAGYETKRKQPDFDKLSRIADFFSVSVDYLLGRTDDKNEVIVPDSFKNKHSVTKRDLSQLDNVLNNVGTFFMNDQVNDEDKEKLMRDIQDLFWEAKDINKEKYGRKKK